MTTINFATKNNIVTYIVKTGSFRWP